MLPTPTQLTAIKAALFAACLIPLAQLGWLGWTDALGANPIEFITRHLGTWTLNFLLITLAVTPLRHLFPRQVWTRRLAQNRRYFGVASFAYALPHVLAYLIRKEEFALIAEEAAYPEIWTGWIAMAIFLPLALSSNNWSVRRMGRAWNHLHRFVHLAALLVFAHWVLSAFDPLTAYLHLAVLGVLETVRLWKTYGPRG